MISYEIQRPKPKTLYQQAKERLLDHADWGRQQGVPRVTSTGGCWDKLRYTKWLEDEIRPKWPKGMLCTLKVVEPKQAVIPAPLFRVDELQEVCWMAPIADTVNEPRAVLVRQAVTSIVQIAYPPAMLRPLTDEETKLVHLRDSTKQNEPAADLYAG